jgi:hypothetical protein
VAVWVVAVIPGLAAQAPIVPSIVKTEAAPEWDAKFAGKKGWIGGDGVYSVVLSPRRVLWLFGDTILGEVQEGRRTGSVMVNNTLGLQTGRGTNTAVRFVNGEMKDGKPSAFFVPADGEGFFWPQAAIRVGDRLLLFLSQVAKTADGGAFGFKLIGQWLAVVANPDAAPEKWQVKQHQMPFTRFGSGDVRSWGSAAITDGEHLYVYGYQERGKGFFRRRLTVARVPADKTDDFGAWRFRTTKGWSEKPEDSAPLADGLATEFSVSRAPGGQGFVAVYTENGLGDRIVARFAGAPEGPWSAPVLLYKCPDIVKDRGVFCYAAKAHPWAADGDELLVSYCVNAWKFARLFGDDRVYRPKFVRVKLAPPR